VQKLGTAAVERIRFENEEQFRTYVRNLRTCLVISSFRAIRDLTPRAFRSSLLAVPFLCFVSISRVFDNELVAHVYAMVQVMNSEKQN
jgi:hypothetical protein